MQLTLRCTRPYLSVAGRLTVWWRGARLVTLRLDGRHPTRCDGYNCRNCVGRLACGLARGCTYREGAWGGVCDYEVLASGLSPSSLHVYRTHEFVPVRIEIADERLSVQHDGHAYVEGAERQTALLPSSCPNPSPLDLPVPA